MSTLACVVWPCASLEVDASGGLAHGRAGYELPDGRVREREVVGPLVYEAAVVSAGATLNIHFQYAHTRPARNSTYTQLAGIEVIGIRERGADGVGEEVLVDR